jgi:DNA-binding beta-propeller fold protein YncE
MKRALLPGLLVTIGLASFGVTLHSWRSRNFQASDHPGWNPAQTSYRLPNGWSVSPVGKLIDLPGDMPATILVSPDGAYAMVNTCGYHDHSVSVVDLRKVEIASSIKLDRSWIGLAKYNDTIYTSGGNPGKNGDFVYRLSTASGSMNFVKKAGLVDDQISPEKRFASGIAVDEEGNVYVLNIQSDEILKYDPAGRLIANAKTGYRPYGLALLPGRRVAISNWGDKSVLILSSLTLDEIQQVGVGDHPCAIVAAPDGRTFVSNAGDVTVSVIGKDGVEETIRTGLEMQKHLGSTPVAIAVSPDGKSLFVANAGENCVTMVDVSAPKHSKVLGLIPTDRYPSAVAVTPDGKKLLVATAKGDYGPNALDLDNPSKHTRPDSGYVYIPNQLTGKLAIIDIPRADVLQGYTNQVLKNADHGQSGLFTADQRRNIERAALQKIHHVVYIVKENRTYDQVLGDMPKGNGVANLTLFGQRVTPNIHALADSFVLFDNLYTDGEVSQCGHQWTDAAYANDYTEKQWVLSYSGKGEVESDKRLFASPGDYIWTLARKHGKSAMVYGEYVNLQEDHDSAEPELVPHLAQLGFSPEFDRIWKAGARDPQKVDLFLSDMHKAESSGKWYDFMEMALPEDHTKGLSPGALSPSAMVGSNDQAIGELLDGISHSRFWKDTAVFIIEDDAQNGPDHVDSHRTEGLVVSPYMRRSYVDSTHYSTSSMLKTMELILGLPPMTEYDALATPMYGAFSLTPNLNPFTLIPPTTDLNAKNPARGALEARSAKLDFSDLDRADPDKLNHILWEAYRPGVPYPAPVRTGFMRTVR